MRAPVALNLHQHLLLSALILTILVCVKRYLEALICPANNTDGHLYRDRHLCPLLSFSHSLWGLRHWGVLTMATFSQAVDAPFLSSDRSWTLSCLS